MTAGLAGRQFVGRKARSFAFRALKPVLDLHAFEACGQPDGADAADLWIRDYAGHKAMAAASAGTSPAGISGRCSR